MSSLKLFRRSEMHARLFTGARRLLLGSVLGLLALAPLGAWPATAYPRVFKSAGRYLPAALTAFLTDFDPVISKPCGSATGMVCDIAITP